MNKQKTVASTTFEVQQKKPNWLLGFTGLIPVVLAIPIIVLQLWTVSIIVTIVSALIVISYHLSRKQGITSLDIFSLLFGCMNAILYLGFHSTILLQHLDTIIYTILFLQVAYSLLVNKPWTEQYAKRMVSAEMWETKPFHGTNRFLSLLWGGAFLACALASVLLPVYLMRVLLPILLLVLLAVLTPRLTRWFATRYEPRFPPAQR